MNERIKQWPEGAERVIAYFLLAIAAFFLLGGLVIGFACGWIVAKL